MKKTIITVTGASGAGKDSLVDALLLLNNQKESKDINNIAIAFTAVVNKEPYAIKELISHTTRQPRDGEIDGVDYYYIDKKTFGDIEKVEETEYAGNHYCLAVSELENIPENGYGIVVVDKTGVEHIKKYVDNHRDTYDIVRVFLMINESTSKSRMLNRGDKIEVVEKRLQQHKDRKEYTATEEEFDYILPAGSLGDYLFNVLHLNDWLRSRALS